MYIIVFLAFWLVFLFNESCTVVLLEGHVFFTCSDSFAVGCIV